MCIVTIIQLILIAIAIIRKSFVYPIVKVKILSRLKITLTFLIFQHKFETSCYWIELICFNRLLLAEDYNEHLLDC